MMAGAWTLPRDSGRGAPPTYEALALTRTLSLKRLLLLLGVVGGAYILAIVGYLSLSLLPTASQLRNDASELLAVHQGVAQCIEDLHDAVMGGEGLLRDRRAAGPLPSDSADLYRERVEPLFHSATEGGPEPRDHLPASVRGALETAEAGELAVGRSMLAALDALELGDYDEAIVNLVEADHDRAETEEALVRAQTLAMEEVLVRERRLQDEASRAVLVLVGWGTAGAIFVLVGFLALRSRLYRPLGQLEMALASVTAGELGATVSIQSGDEMGRLGSMLNQMIGVLRERDAEAELRERNLIERYSRILEEAATSLVVVDPATMTTLAASDRVLTDLGVDAESFKGRSVEEVWIAAPGLVADVLAEVSEKCRDRGVFLADQTRADGSTAKVEVSAFCVCDEDDREIVAVVHDLTERRGLEYVHDQLARFALENVSVLEGGDTQAVFTKVTELASELLGVEVVGIWIMDGPVLRCVDSYDRRTRSHSSGTEIRRDAAPSYFAALETTRAIAASDALTDPATADLREYLTSEGVHALLDVPFRRRGNVAGVMCHEHHGTPRVWTPEEKVLGAAMGDFVAHVLERAERLEAEAALRESELRYRMMFESAAIGISELDGEGRFVGVNATMRDMLGYGLDEFQRMSWRDVTHPDDRHADQIALEEFRSGTRDVYRREKRYLRKDGTPLWVEIHEGCVRDEDGALSRLVTVVKDISTARELQHQLAHAQRMDSVGRLAGGIAHDFNNLLTAVLGNAEILRRRIDSASDLLVELTEIEESARRATGLTRQLLTFARRQTVQPSVVELDEVAQDAERLLRRLIGEDIDLRTELKAPGAQIRIDPQQFDQVIVNLTVNARDAMPEGGTITIRTKVVSADLVPGLRRDERDTDYFVVLEVEDDGRGMDRRVQQRVFEPFFTTKEAGEGTGLGLATCYGIVGQAGGRIDVESTPWVGSVFRVYLPAVNESVAGEPDPLGEPDFVVGRTVLVVEDADPVRRLIVESLERKGYTVLEASDGEDAVALAASYDGVIHIAVSDIVMPRMNGPKAIEAIRVSRPDIRVLFISGYSAETVRDGALESSNTAFLSKPFTPSELVHQVNELAEDVARSEVGFAQGDAQRWGPAAG